MLHALALAARNKIMLTAVLAAVLLTTCLTAYHLHSSEGLACEDFANPDWEGEPAARRIERDMTARVLGASLLFHSERFSTRCSGWFFVPAPGDTTFLLESDDGSDLYIDGARILDNGGRHGRSAVLQTVDLFPGPHRIAIRYAQAGGDFAFSLLAAAHGEALHPLDANHIARRPLTRLEQRLRPWAGGGAAAVVMLCAAGLALTWRDRLRAAARRLARIGAAAHRAALASERRRLTVLLTAAIAARAVLTPITHAILWPDSDVYLYTARDLLHGRWSSHEIFRTPGYSAFIAPFLASGETPAAGLRLIAAQRLLGIVITLFVYRIGSRAFSTSTALYAALLWTLSPLALYYETVVSTETVFVFVLMLALCVAIGLLERPHLWLATGAGILCGLAVLVRPVAKGLIVTLLPLVAVQLGVRRAWRLGVAMLVAYALCVGPWMIVNSRSYGFLGISRGEGLGLVMRVFDVERLTPPEASAYPDVREAFVGVAAQTPFVHYRLRDVLDYERGYSAVGADRIMVSFALETARLHPFIVAGGIALDWINLFTAPHRSVDVCDSDEGPVLCAARNRDAAHPPFPQRPLSGFRPMKRVVAAYMNAAYGLLPILSPLALIGAILAVRRSPDATFLFMRLLLVATIVYFTLVSVTFNTFEDRYRLPVDPLILLFAVHCIEAAGSWFFRQIDSGTTVPAHRVAA